METGVLLLLVTALVTIFHAQGNPMLPSRAAFDKQVKLYNERMDAFMNEAEKSRITLDRKDENDVTAKVEFDLYKIGANEMELKTVFDLLQNWYHYVDKLANEKGLEAGKERTDFIEKQRYFELNIGGDDYRFGIELVDSTKEILIVGDDGKAPPYSELYKTFSDANGPGVKKIAKELLNAADSVVKNQPKWVDTIKDPKVMGDMRMFSVITQIAEGARPSEEFFNKMKTASEGLYSTRFESFKAVDTFLHNKMYKPISSIFNGDPLDVETYSKYRDFVTVIEQAETVLNKITLKKRQIATIDESNLIPSGEKDNFFGELTEVPFDDKNINLKKFLGKYGLEYKKIDKLKEAITDLKSSPAGAADQEDLKNAVESNLRTAKGKKTKNNLDFDNHNREITDRILKELKITEHSDRFFQRIQGSDLEDTNALRKFLKKLQFQTEGQNLDALVDAIQKLKEEGSKPETTASDQAALRKAIEDNLPRVTESFCKALSDAARESHSALTRQTFEYYTNEILPQVEGRIPGAGDLVRYLLQQLETGKLNSFEDVSRVSLFMEQNGLIPSRIQAIEQSSFLQDDIKMAYDNAIKSLDLKTSAVLQNMEETATELIGATCSNYHAPLTDKYLDEKRSRLMAAASLFKQQDDESCRINNDEELVEDSLKWEGDHLEFETINKKGVKQLHERKLPLEENEFAKYSHEEVATKSHLTKKFGTGIGVYGSFVAIVSSIKQFQDGNYGQGAFSAFQAIHSIGGLTGLNEKLSRAIIDKSLNSVAEKFASEKILEKLAEPLAKGLGRAGKVFSRFLENVPLVGLGFDIYFITEDIKDLQDKDSKTPEFLKVAHLILDVETTILSLVGTFVPELEPIIEPIVIVLTIIRITIDDFYIDIKSELDKAKGKDFGAKVKAFFKGFAEGVADVFTLGLVNQLNQLIDAAEQNQEFFNNLKDPENYFNKTFAEQGEINFNSGTMSGYGGFLSVTLNDDGSFTMELPEVYIGETPRKIKKTFKFDHPAKDIVLGLGTTVSPQYIHQTAKLWLLIPIKSYDIVESFLEHNSSRYGTYYGNKYDNNFYAVQQANISSDYHYNLYGRGGDDKFFLGPQTSFVLGGDGKDIYSIPQTGGEATIDNFALDEKMDTLYIKISHRELKCFRVETDLVILNNVSTAVILKHWFIQGERDEYFRHISISTRDGIQIDVSNTSVSGNNHQTICKVAAINKARSKQGTTIDLRDDSFEETKRAVGSNFSDTIYGNEEDNLLFGGLGNDIICGGNGSDKYLIRKGDGVDIIKNYAKDKKMDTILFGINYTEISLEKQGNDLVMVDSSNPQETKIILSSWFSGHSYQHANFMSQDYVIFLVTNDGDTITKDAITIDLSNKDQGVTVNLQNQTLNKGITLNSEAMRDVKLLMDSPHDDRLVGNTRNNIMSCTGGKDYLQGNAGSDTYIIKPTCNGAQILNHDDFGKPQYDLLMFTCESSKTRMSVSGTNLVMRCTGRRTVDVVLLKWFESSLYQHLMVKTQDKWTFLPPVEEKNLSSIIEPYQIETTESCNGQTRTMDFTQAQFQNVQRFTASSSLCEYNIVGNNLDNYFDLGPSNSYGFRVIEGGKGSDTYVFGYLYGVNNRINNYATDGQYDHLKFDVVYEYIELTLEDDDVIISSALANNSVAVKLLNYFQNSSYQHLLIHSSDGALFQIKMVDFAPVKEIAMVKYSKSPYSQIISAINDESLRNVRQIIGSATAANSIHGGSETMKITGGEKSDTITGGSFPLGEDIKGMDGDDYIDGKEGDDSISGGNGNDMLIGGKGNDVIFGGKGADTIRGGSGTDTVVFSGSAKTKTGVFVDLQSGIGLYADAHGDKFQSIENVLGSEYSDSLVGNNDNNFINGYAGEDYIVAAGGFDNLKGGLDSDIYDMKNAFGLKIINNFATDTNTDTLLLSDSSRQQMCYFFNEDDLHVNIDYGDNSARGAMGRAVLGEGLLEIKLVSWLSNATYQHLQIIFSDGGVLNGADLSEDGRQMRSTVQGLLNQTTGIQIASVNETTVVLTFNYQFINEENPLPSETELIWVHSGQNKLQRYPLNVDTSSNLAMMTVTDLKQGINQLFYVFLKSCNVTVAVSPLTVVTTPPNPPVNITIYPAVSGIDGFTVHWLPPDESTDPNAFYYFYTIKYWQRDTPHEALIIDHNNFLFRNYTALNLVPNTNYELAIASKVGNTTGKFSSPVTVHTGYTSCINFFSLPNNNSHIRNVENDQGRLVASVYCDPGYEVNGTRYIGCNETSTPIPECVLLHCDLQLDDSYNAVQATGSQNPMEGENVLWKCANHSRTEDGAKYFSSTCTQGIWDPPLRSCIPEPSCSKYPPLANGNIDPPFAYLNDKITFSCSGDYTRRGPRKKICMSHSGSRSSSQPQSDLYYHPTTPVECVRLPCTELLPQPHGKYNISSDGFAAEVICDNGYFVSTTDADNPERMTLSCTREGTWSVQQSQRTCRPMLEAEQPSAIQVIEEEGKMSGYVRYTLPQWRSQTTLPDNLNQIACDVLGLDTFVVKSGLRVSCTITFRLIDNPPLDNGDINRYRGKLTWVRSALGTTENVCVEYTFDIKVLMDRGSTGQPFLLCRWLGLAAENVEYKYSYYPVTPFEATKVISISTVTANAVEIKDQTKLCSTAISCRATCDPLRLDSASNGCDKTLEGESCAFTCPPGEALLGSPTRTCQRRGTWSGSTNNCDADNWKEEIDRIAHDQRKNQDLDDYLYDHLTREFPGVSWLVLVYEPVATFENHKYSSYTNLVYHKWRYEGNNIVVGRLLSPASSRDLGLAQKLESAVRPYLNSYCNDIGALVDRAETKLTDDNRDINVRFIHGLKIKKYSSFGHLTYNEWETRFKDARNWWDKRAYVTYFENGDSCKVVISVLALPR